MYRKLRAYVGHQMKAHSVASELRSLDNRELDDLGIGRRNIALIANLSAAR